MNEVRTFAEDLLSLRTAEVRHLAEILKTEYGVEAKNADEPHLEKGLIRQQRRKLERENKRKNKWKRKE